MRSETLPSSRKVQMTADIPTLEALSRKDVRNVIPTFQRARNWTETPIGSRRGLTCAVSPRSKGGTKWPRLIRTSATWST